jgi:hypothetical protein
MYLRKHLVSYIQYFIIADKLEQVFVGPHKGDDINTSVDAQANIASGVEGEGVRVRVRVRVYD